MSQWFGGITGILKVLFLSLRIYLRVKVAHALTPTKNLSMTSVLKLTLLFLSFGISSGSLSSFPPSLHPAHLAATSLFSVLFLFCFVNFFVLWVFLDFTYKWNLIKNLRLTIPNIGTNAELQNSHTLTGETVNWYNLCGKNIW